MSDETTPQDSAAMPPASAGYARHTPGPWRTTKHGTVEGYSGRHAHPCDDGYRPLASYNATNVGDDWRDNEMANGLLIAAAPDLFSALYGIVRSLDEGYDEGFDQWIDKGRAAVAKALGRQA